MRRSLALACALALCAAPTGAQQAPPICTIRETSRAPLVVDGTREMYVEPTVVLPSRAEILFAGSPNYLWAPGRAGDTRDFVRDSVFGAILGPDGDGRLLPPPPRIDPTRVTAIRGALLPNGHWAIVFGETARPSANPAADSLRQWWHAVHDGKAWTTIERLPLPVNGAFLTGGASDLVVRGDTMFFAARLESSEKLQHIALFERRQGRWMIDVLPTRNASYVQLGYSNRDGLLVAIVRPRGTTEWDINSMFIHPRTAPWASARLLVRGGMEPVYDPVFSGTPEAPVLTWWVQPRSGAQRSYAMVGSPLDDRPVLSIDSTAGNPVPVHGRGDVPIWITEVRSPGQNDLRVSARGFAGIAEVARMPNPYTGYFAAAATSRDAMIIAGPLLRREPPNPSLVTLLIRFRVDCASGAPRPDSWTLARRVYVHPPPGGLNDSTPAIPRAPWLRDDPVRVRERERAHRPTKP